MKMKISNREKVMVGILCVMLFISVYYNFIYSPQKKEIDTLVAQKAKYDEKLTLLSKEALNLQNVSKNIKIINANILGLSEDLLPPVAEEKIILIMDDLINKSQLKVGGFTISQCTLEPVGDVTPNSQEKGKASLQVIVDEYEALSNGEQVKVNTENKEDTTSKKDKDGKDSEATSDNKENKDDTKKLGTTVEKVSVSMGYQGTYNELNSLIKAVETFPEKIIISNLTISASETSVTGNLMLDFYFIPKINSVGEYMPWTYKNKYGKDNPFKGTSTESSTNTTVASKKYDFRMMVKPTSSDLPTMILGKVEDTSRSTYLYADNSQIENMEIYFTEVNGKYYYKYKATDSSYPLKFDGNGVEFKPSEEDININIVSIVRNSLEDVNGVNFKVYNNTSKKVYVKLEKDDETRPRVMISGEKGNVYIEK